MNKLNNYTDCTHWFLKRLSFIVSTTKSMIWGHYWCCLLKGRTSWVCRVVEVPQECSGPSCTVCPCCHSSPVYCSAEHPGNCRWGDSLDVHSLDVHQCRSGCQHFQIHTYTDPAPSPSSSVLVLLVPVHTALHTWRQNCSVQCRRVLTYCSQLVK